MVTEFLHSKSFPFILITTSIIMIIIIIYIPVVFPQYESIPTQQFMQDKYFDIYIRYNKVIAVDPLASLKNPIKIYLKDRYNNMSNNNSNLTPKIINPIILDYSFDNSTNVVMSTSFMNNTNKDEFKADLLITHPNDKTGMTKEDFEIDMLYYTTNNNHTINYTTLKIPISFSIIYKDLNPFVYLLFIFVGVVASLYISEFSKQQGISLSKIVSWLILSLIVATIVFSQFKEQISKTSDLFTNVILAIGIGYGAQKILTEASRETGSTTNGNSEQKKNSDEGSKRYIYTPEGKKKERPSV